MGAMLGGSTGLLTVERLVLRINGLRSTVRAGVQLSIVGPCLIQPDGRVVMV
ncbi:hypothetical protein D9M69_712990 [compost metagenome]